MTALSIPLPLGILVPESLLRTEAFAVLAGFVAINTAMYVTLAIAKVLPKVYLTDLFNGANRRHETRSIHPDGPARVDLLPRNGRTRASRRS